jgi:excisionase family DNA binding protein
MTSKKIEKVQEYLTLTEAAEYSHVTRQAVYVAIRKGKLQARKKGRKWLMTKEEIDAYRAIKYDPDRRRYQGQEVFDFEKGYFSVTHVSKIISASLGRPYGRQRVYYLIRSGELKAARKGHAWVIHKIDAMALLEKENKLDQFELGLG